MGPQAAVHLIALSMAETLHIMTDSLTGSHLSEALLMTSAQISLHYHCWVPAMIVHVLLQASTSVPVQSVQPYRYE